MYEGSSFWGLYSYFNCFERQKVKKNNNEEKIEYMIEKEIKNERQMTIKIEKNFSISHPKKGQ